MTFTGPDGRTCRGPGPRPTTPRGAVLVIHENRGLTDHIRSVAGRLRRRRLLRARHRPALGGGRHRDASPIRRRPPPRWPRSPPERFVADMKAGIDELERRDARTKIGAVGFCFGGGMVWQLLASGEPRLAAAVPFYGPLPEDADFSGSKARGPRHLRGAGRPRERAPRRSRPALTQAGLTHEIVTVPAPTTRSSTTPAPATTRPPRGGLRTCPRLVRRIPGVRRANEQCGDEETEAPTNVPRSATAAFSARRCRARCTRRPRTPRTPPTRACSTRYCASCGHADPTACRFRWWPPPPDRWRRGTPSTRNKTTSRGATEPGQLLRERPLVLPARPAPARTAAHDTAVHAQDPQDPRGDALRAFLSRAREDHHPGAQTRLPDGEFIGGGRAVLPQGREAPASTSPSHRSSRFAHCARSTSPYRPRPGFPARVVEACTTGARSAGRNEHRVAHAVHPHQGPVLQRALDGARPRLPQPCPRRQEHRGRVGGVQCHDSVGDLLGGRRAGGEGQPVPHAEPSPALLGFDSPDHPSCPLGLVSTSRRPSAVASTRASVRVPRSM